MVDYWPLDWTSRIVPTRKADSAAWLASSNLGSHALIFDDDEVVQLLKAAVEREGNQRAFATRHRLNRTLLNRILKGKGPVNANVVKALGLQKVYTAKL
jgi:DNA-binding phage protein